MSDYIEKLKGCRASKNRDEVLEILNKQTCPLTIDELYEKIKVDNPTMSLSTVYRIIDKLVNLKVARKAVILDDNKARYEIATRHHHHYMICTKCKKMIPIDCCPIEDFEKNLENTTGFNITGHKFELYGECKSCLEKEKAKE